MAMDTNRLVETLRTVFQEEGNVKFAYLFGSRANDTAGPLSDYDVAVYLDENDPIARFYKRLDLIGKVAKAVGDNRVDVVVLNDTDAPLLLYDIISGTVVFSRDDAERVAFEARVLSLYFDFRYLLTSHPR